MRNRRPITVTLLAWLISLAIIWNGIRLKTAFAFMGVLAEYSSPPLVIYLIFSASIWMIIGIVLLWGIFSRKSWGREAFIGNTLLQILIYILDRLILQKPHANWLFVIGILIIYLLIISLLIFNRKTRQYFTPEGAHGRESENPESA
jgi:hypothetical protein